MEIETVDWQERASMCLPRLSPHVEQYGGFTPAKRAFERTTKLPNGALANPHFSDLMNQNESPVKQTSDANVKLRAIHNASIGSDSQ